MQVSTMIRRYSKFHKKLLGKNMQNRMSGKMATPRTEAIAIYHMGSVLAKMAYKVSPINMQKTMAAQIMTLSGVNHITKPATMKDHKAVKVNSRI